MPRDEGFLRGATCRARRFLPRCARGAVAADDAQFVQRSRPASARSAEGATKFSSTESASMPRAGSPPPQGARAPPPDGQPPRAAGRSAAPDGGRARGGAGGGARRTGGAPVRVDLALVRRRVAARAVSTACARWRRGDSLRLGSLLSRLSSPPSRRVFRASSAQPWRAFWAGRGCGRALPPRPRCRFRRRRRRRPRASRALCELGLGSGSARPRLGSARRRRIPPWPSSPSSSPAALAALPLLPPPSLTPFLRT